MPKDKKKTSKEIKSKYKTRGKRAGPKMSRGQRSFQVGKELREQAASYTEQVTEEAEKAGKRKGASSWGSLLGSIGAPLAALALASNPIGWAAMAAIAGGGALAGSAAGVAASKNKRGGRKNVEVDKFYTSEASQANKDIKEIDKQTRKQAYVSAGTSAVLAGIGTAAKAGKFASKTQVPVMEGGKQKLVEGTLEPMMKTEVGSMFSKFTDLGKKIGADEAWSFGGKAGKEVLKKTGEDITGNVVKSTLRSGLEKSFASALGTSTISGVGRYGYGFGNRAPSTQTQNPYAQNQNPYGRRRNTV